MRFHDPKDMTENQWKVGNDYILCSAMPVICQVTQEIQAIPLNVNLSCHPTHHGPIIIQPLIYRLRLPLPDSETSSHTRIIAPHPCPS